MDGTQTGPSQVLHKHSGRLGEVLFTVPVASVLCKQIPEHRNHKTIAGDAGDISHTLLRNASRSVINPQFGVREATMFSASGLSPVCPEVAEDHTVLK